MPQEKTTKVTFKAQGLLIESCWRNQVIQIACPAVCGNFDLCLIACPHNAQLDQLLIPVCDTSTDLSASDDEEWLIVVEEPNKHEKLK